MDNKKFIEKLDQCCEWAYPVVTEVSGHERIGLYRTSKASNWKPVEAMGPRITAIKSDNQCEYCENTNAHIGYQKVNHPRPGWYVYCYTCKHNINIKTKQRYKLGKKPK